MNLALDGGKWSASRSCRALTPGTGLAVPIVQEAGWAPEPVWTQGLEEKSFRLCRGPNLDLPVVQPVARHYTDCATRLTTSHCIKTKYPFRRPSVLSERFVYKLLISVSTASPLPIRFTHPHYTNTYILVLATSLCFHIQLNTYSEFTKRAGRTPVNEREDTGRKTN
jgi:hypothetical protein